MFVENGIPIFKCNHCNHAFSGYEQEEHYDGYWGEDSKEFDLDWWDHAHRKIYSEFINHFMTKQSGTVLDVGCGLGFFVKMVQEKKTQWKPIGYEMSLPAVKFANEVNKLSNVYAGMVQNSGLPSQSVDIITLWDVIEHIPKPQPLLQYLHGLLKEDGFLFLQTPNFPIQLWKAKLKVLLKGMKPDVHYLEAKDHVNDYTRESLTKLALDNGFQKPDFFILPPILSVSGSSSVLGKIGKISYYHLTKWIWHLSFHFLFLNNTLFAVLRKK